FVWRRDGVTWSNSSFSTVLLLNVTSADAGHYSVVVSNSAGMLTNEVGSLKVVPFSDPSCFWAQRGGGTEPGVSQATYATAVVTDAANNLYVVGAFDVKAVFGPFTLTSAGSRDLYVAKLSPAGEYLWAVRGGGGSAEYAAAAGLDAGGNLYIAGTFEGTTTFGT